MPVLLSELREACSVHLGDHFEEVRRKGERSWHPIREMVGFIPSPQRRFSHWRTSFSTGLYDRSQFSPKPIFCGSWHFDFRQTFSLFETRLRTKVDAWETYGGHPHLENMPPEYGVSAPETLIFCRSQEVADQIMLHLNAAMILFNGYAPFERDNVSVQQDKLSRLPGAFQERDPYRSVSRVAADGVLASCKFVAATWRKDPMRMALARLYHSTHLAYFHPLDASPSFGDFADFDTSTYPLMAYALAITAAYSAIEELDCQPKVKRRGDYVLKDGKWNPSVVEELKQRLSRLGLDPQEEVIWMIRGRRRVIESKVAPAKGSEAPWKRRRVDDRLVPLHEAILLSSRIRNRAAAHNTKRETRALTPVDLVNVQSVCRHLLMASAGLPVGAWVKQEDGILEFK